jgi:hypothetical protein
MSTEGQIEPDSTLSKVFSWVAGALGFGFTSAVLFVIIRFGFSGYWNDITLEHLVCIVGLPWAAVASLVLVLILRTVAGNIELKVFGIEFRGASGPIIMWILCFLSIVLAITKTWDLTYVNKVGKGATQVDVRQTPPTK